jgi:N-acetylmuramoyl-L-alanine amidase
MDHPPRIGTVPLVVVSMLLWQTAVQPAWGEAAGGPPKIPVLSTCDRAQFVVVVDVGHTLEAPGALSARGVREYEFNLRLAKLIEHDLMEAGFDKTVLLVTDGPAMKGLFKRVERANSLQAKLFLSIHHDSVPDSFLEDWDYEGIPSHFSDRFKGHSIFVSYQNSNRKASLLFGKLLGDQLNARGLQYTHHYTEEIMGRRRRELVDAEAGVYRYDKLIVLKDTQMPAVLLEAGSIINRDEELLLDSPEHQSLISAAATQAVETFCVLRSPRPQIARRGRPDAIKQTVRPAAAAQANPKRR